MYSMSNPLDVITCRLIKVKIEQGEDRVQYGDATVSKRGPRLLPAGKQITSLPPLSLRWAGAAGVPAGGERGAWRVVQEESGSWQN